MKKLNIKIIIAIVIVLSALSLAFIFSVTKKSKQSAQKSSQQTLNIPNYFEGANFAIENNIKETDFNFSPSLPYLKQNTQGVLSDSTAKTIAKNLGFTSDPITASDAQNGVIMIWNNDNFSLMVTLKTSSLQYSSNTGIRLLVENAVNKQVSDKGYQSLGTEFLLKNIGLAADRLNFIGFTYYKVASGVEYLAKTIKDQADVIQVNYSLSPSGFPVFTTNPDNSQMSVQLLKDGSVINFEGEIGSSFTESTEKLQILDYAQFSQMLSQSIIVSLNNNSINIPDLINTDISGIKVNKVSIVYLLDNQNSISIQPVFLIEGTAEIKNFGGSVDVLMYLPAFQSLVTSKP